MNMQNLKKLFLIGHRNNTIISMTYCEVEKKCIDLKFEYLQKLQELALDIYGGFTSTS